MAVGPGAGTTATAHDDTMTPRRGAGRHAPTRRQVRRRHEAVTHGSCRTSTSSSSQSSWDALPRRGLQRRRTRDMGSVCSSPSPPAGENETPGVLTGAGDPVSGRSTLVTGPRLQQGSSSKLQQEECEGGLRRVWEESPPTPRRRRRRKRRLRQEDANPTARTYIAQNECSLNQTEIRDPLSEASGATHSSARKDVRENSEAELSRTRSIGEDLSRIGEDHGDMILDVECGEATSPTAAQPLNMVPHPAALGHHAGGGGHRDDDTGGEQGPGRGNGGQEMDADSGPQGPVFG